MQKWNKFSYTCLLIFSLFVFLYAHACGLVTNDESVITPSWPLNEAIYLLGIDEIYSGLNLEVISLPKDITKGGTIDLILTNRTDKRISFAPGYGARLFVYDHKEEGWIEISNLVDYFGQGDLLEPKLDENINWVAYITVAPDFSSVDNPKRLRIAVVGNLVNDDLVTDIKVGTYLDIDLMK